MDLNLKSVTKFVEDRSWLRSPLAARTFSGTLDVSDHVLADMYPDGYMPSGTVLGKITASGLYKWYNPAESDGSETAVGLLFSSVVVDLTDLTVDVGIAIMHHGDIISTALHDTGSTTNGGWDAASAVDLTGQIVDLA